MSLSRQIPSPLSLLIAAAIGCIAIACGCGSSAAQDDASAAAAASAGDEDRANDADKGPDAGQGEKEEKLQSLELARGRLVLQVPARWEKQRPASRIIEVELKVPAKEEEADEGGDPADKDATAGRLTITAAGGSIEANIDRWIGQFKQPDGKPSREAAKIEEKEYDGLKVHLFDLAGTFADSRGGPFAPAAEAKELENHRMLAAIIVTDGAGYYFVKFTGPQETVKQNAAVFWRAIEGLEWN